MNMSPAGGVSLAVDEQNVGSAPGVPRKYQQTVPTEIWLEIFRSSELCSQDIENLTLVCQPFRRIAQPMLFEVFAVTHRVATRKRDGTSWQTKEHCARLDQRLEFFCSERIAYVVRRLAVNLDDCEEMSARHTVEGHLAMNKLFDRVTQLPNIRSIAARDVQLDSCRLKRLYELPLLAHLHLRDYAIAEPAPPLRLKSLTLDGFYCVPNNGAWWTPMLDPSSIERLCLVTTLYTDSHIRTLASAEPMPFLRVLHLSSKAPACPDFIRALSKCPAVEELRLSFRWNTHDPVSYHNDAIQMPTPPEQVIETPALPEDILPRLTSVRASRNFVLANVRGRPVRRIHIESLIDDAEQLISELSSLRPDVEDLTLNVSMFPASLLSTFFRSFRHLKRCCIRTRQFYPGAEEEMVSLLRSISLPPGLESLHIGAICDTYEVISHGYRAKPCYGTTQVLAGTELDELVSNWRQQCPRLTDVMITSLDINVVWHSPGTNGFSLQSENWSWGYRPQPNAFKKEELIQWIAKQRRRPRWAFWD